MIASRDATGRKVRLGSGLGLATSWRQSDKRFTKMEVAAVAKQHYNVMQIVAYRAEILCEDGGSAA